MFAPTNLELQLVANGCHLTLGTYEFVFENLGAALDFIADYAEKPKETIKAFSANATHKWLAPQFDAPQGCACNQACEARTLPVS